VPQGAARLGSMSAMMLYIITNAVLFSFLMTSREQIPQQMAAWIVDMGVNWWTFLIFVNILLLVAGNVMEASSIVLIMAPILFPVAMKLGIIRCTSAS
jgi:C4-dicarboxylate transporter DctM subunit